MCIFTHCISTFCFKILWTFKLSSHTLQTTQKQYMNSPSTCSNKLSIKFFLSYVFFYLMFCYVNNWFHGHDKLTNLCSIWITYNVKYCTLIGHSFDLHVCSYPVIAHLDWKKNKNKACYAQLDYDIVSFNMFRVNFF